MDCPHRRWGGEEYRARHLPIEVRARGVGGANVTHSKCPPPVTHNVTHSVPQGAAANLKPLTRRYPL